MAFNENIKYKGHFKIQSIDSNNNIIDEWEDKNMIMESSSISMAEIFAMNTTSFGINKFVLGTAGHEDDNIMEPRDSETGFVKERDRLFSEYSNIEDNQSITLRKNDIFKYVGSSNETGEGGNFYHYSGDEDELLTSEIDFSDTNYWEDLGTESPYTYNINFALPGNNGSCLNITEDSALGSSTVEIEQVNEKVTFIINVSTASANEQGTLLVGTSVFTEAALYANDRIFSMKTFAAKIKDSTVLLRIIWTISF